MINRKIMPYRDLLLIIFLLITSCKTDTEVSYRGWEVYGGTGENIKYSSLTQIDTHNVKDLEVAWQYSAGDADSTNKSDMKVNPVVVDDILYGLSPKLKLFALDAATGEELWEFDPVYLPLRGTNMGRGDVAYSTYISRGLAFYKGKDGDHRILYTPGGAHLLYCIDAHTGKPVPSFGNNGYIDLHDDLGRDIDHLHISNTSPGIIYKDLIIIGSRVAEGARSAPGHIRAYDVHTGELRWRFHTIPQPGEPGYETWDDPEAYQYIGGANVWGGFSLDEERGIVFAGTGSATDDFYGGKRTGDNLFANTVLALDAETGERIWHYQTVHHDVWDWDLPTPPILATIQHDGKPLDVAVQITKQGFIFMFDRETGEPVHPIEEVPVPTQTELEGEKLSPTQPVPTFFKPYVRQVLTEEDLFREGIPEESYRDIKERLSTYITGNMWNPPSLQGTLQIPGLNGGGEWGGPSFDPETGIMYINANESPWVTRMVEVEDETPDQDRTNLQAGKALYRRLCRGCHGDDRRGGETNPVLGNNPSLAGIEKQSNMNPEIRYDEASFKNLITTGRGNTMPPFSHLSEAEKTALASYILNIEEKQQETFTPPPGEKHPYFDLPYQVAGGKFLTKEGYPAVKPPWGHLTAVNLETGEEVWKETIGDYPELKAQGVHAGSENFGSSVVTAGGLLFIGATRDEKFRAFNKGTGELLWEADLPAAGIATPTVYEVNGRQFVVIACGGGGKQQTKSGDTYMAFALPQPAP